MTQILFVCTANRYRSVIAAACFLDELIKRKQENNWSVLSAGTWSTDGLQALPEAIQRAKQLGLDLQGHHSRVITGEMLEEADLVLVMEGGQKEALQVEFPFCRNKILMLSEAVEGISYNIPDPIENPLNVDPASEICRLVRIGFNQICALARR